MLPGYDFISSATVALDRDGRDADASDPGDYAPAGACSSRSAAPSSSWRGTHVTGTVAALMSNGLYGTGIAPGIHALPVRVLGRCGGYTSDIVDVMRWAAGIDIAGVPHNANPARVIKLSLGSSGTCSAAFQSAVNDVNARGAIVVVATGNGGYDTVNQPVNGSGVVTVTAHAIDGDSADYANIGPEVTISAPGGGCGTLSATCYASLKSDGPSVYTLGNSELTTPQSDTMPKSAAPAWPRPLWPARLR
jgi:serine protease